MKNLLPLLLFAVLCAGCGGGDNHTEVELNTPEEVAATKAATPDSFDATFADGMTETVYQYYLKLRTALVNSDVDDATAAAANMAESLGDDRPDLRKLARQVAESDDLEAIRKSFSVLTTGLEPLFTEGITDGVMYKQHCPMAFDGIGAEWFSDVDQIRNPYFGDRMLKCGKVVAEIK